MANLEDEGARFQAASMYGLTGQDLDEFIASAPVEAGSHEITVNVDPTASLAISGILAAMEQPQREIY